VLDTIVHPVGKPTCCELGKNVTEAGTCISGLSLPGATVDAGPVLPMVTIISKVPPVVTIPELEGKTFMKGLACPNAQNFEVPIIVKIISNCFKIFIEINNIYF
jgi:hypothetical protein